MISFLASIPAAYGRFIMVLAVPPGELHGKFSRIRDRLEAFDRLGHNP